MEEFLKAFARNPDGSWTCVAPATLRNPYWSIKYTEGATFRPESMFMGVQLTKFLDDYSRRGVIPEGWHGHLGWG